MIIQYHPLVKRDIAEAVDFLDAHSILAGRKFEAEMAALIPAIAAMPTRYSPYRSSPIFRRAKLPSFPYLIIYRIIPKGIRITVIKHERRHPNYGMTRW